MHQSQPPGAFGPPVLDREGRSAALHAFGRALSQESHNVRRWPEATWQQLSNRLRFADLSVHWLIEPEERRRGQHGGKSWFRALKPPSESPALVSVLDGHTAAVTSVAWSPDGTRLASGSWDGTARIWHAATGRELAQLDGHASWILAVAWRLDGTRLATGAGDDSVRVWDVADGREHTRLDGHGDRVAGLAWSPDGYPPGQRLTRSHRPAVGDGTWARAEAARRPRGPRALRGVEPGRRPPGQRLARQSHPALGSSPWGAGGPAEGHTGWVRSVAWSPDGTRLVSGSADDSVRVWDAASGQELARLEGHDQVVSAVAWSPDGTMLASASWDRSVRVWDVATGRQVARLEGHSDEVWTVAWSPDGARLASGALDASVRVWEVTSGRERVRADDHTDEVRIVAWSPDGAHLASGSWDSTVRVWEAESGRVLRRLDGHTDRVSTVAWSPDGARLASAAHGTVKVWEAAGGQETAEARWASSPIAWSPDGVYLATGTAPFVEFANVHGTFTRAYDDMVRLWEAASGRELMRIDQHRDTLRAVVWSPDGQCFASGSADRTVRIWIAATGEELVQIAGHTDRVEAVAWSPNGSRLASASNDRTVRVWEAVSGRETARLEGGLEPIAWSPDGTRLASASDDDTVLVRAGADDREAARLVGHVGRVTAVAWSPDGRHLASGSADRTVRIWEAASGRQLGMVPLLAWPHSLAFHPFRARLAVGTDGDEVWIGDRLPEPYGPLAVTAVDDGNGASLCCLACGRRSPASPGQALTCPGCGLVYQLNRFVTRIAQLRIERVLGVSSPPPSPAGGLRSWLARLLGR